MKAGGPRQQAQALGETETSGPRPDPRSERIDRSDESTRRIRISGKRFVPVLFLWVNLFLNSFRRLYVFAYSPVLVVFPLFSTLLVLF